MASPEAPTLESQPTDSPPSKMVGIFVGSIQGALEAAGIDAGEREALDATLQIGEAIYRRLTRNSVVV